MPKDTNLPSYSVTLRLLFEYGEVTHSIFLHLFISNPLCLSTSNKKVSMILHFLRDHQYQKIPAYYSNTFIFMHLLISSFTNHFDYLLKRCQSYCILCRSISARTRRLTICNTLTIVGVWSSQSSNTYS